LFLPYRQFHHYHHVLRMRCDYLRCLHSFLKIEVDLCFKFDLREVLDIRDFLKETTGALKLRFDCTRLFLIQSEGILWLTFLRMSSQNTGNLKITELHLKKLNEQRVL
jgi:hypothetical protein